MSIKVKQDIPNDLSRDQQKALDRYFNNPKRCSFNTSLRSAILNLREINRMRKEGRKDQADKCEVVWFKVLEYTNHEINKIKKRGE